MSGWDNVLLKYAPPVSQDGFFHIGDSFYVEVDRHRHTRLDSAALYALLTYTEPPPLLTKAGKVAKRQPLPHKDSPDHFYFAQLAHYGLKPLKTKSAAKTHLLAAFDPSTKTLSAPKYILDLEKSLEEQYTQANAIAAKKAKEDKAREKIEEAKKHERRLAEYKAILTEFEDSGPVVGQHMDVDSDEDAAPSKTDTQLRQDLAKLSDKKLREMMTNLVFTVPAVKKAVTKEIDKTSKNPPTKSKKGKSAVLKLSDTMDNEGQYHMVAPYLTEQWPDQTQMMKIRMSPSPGGTHLWVCFDFGVISGIMRSCGPLPMNVGDNVDFLWRGREDGTGETTFGDGNTASIKFIGNGKIRGKMEWMEGFEFAGKKSERQSIVWNKNVTEWKREWKGINQRSYNSANVGRWGSGGWYEITEDRSMTPNSDSDGGGQEDRDLEEEYDQEEDYNNCAF